MGIMSAVEYCRDRGYLTTHVVTPRPCRLSETSPRCIVNYATTDQLDDMHRILQLAAERGWAIAPQDRYPLKIWVNMGSNGPKNDWGATVFRSNDPVTIDDGYLLQEMITNEEGDGVGTDEYEPGSSRANYLCNRSEIFVITTDRKEIHSGSINQADIKARSGKNNFDIAAFIAINPFKGGYDSCLAGIYVFRAPSLAADDVAFRSLVGLGVQLADEINCGYTHAVVEVALCHSKLLQQMKNDEFYGTAIVANSVNIAGVGPCHNVIFFKRFRPDREGRCQAAVLEMLERTEPCADFLTQYPSMSLPKIPFFPQYYTFSCGLETIYRNLRKEDDERLYNMFQECMKLGEGFGSTNFPSLDYFRMHMVAQGRFVVIENLRTGEIVGFTYIRHSPFTRGSVPAVRHTSVINPEYRGRGIIHEAGALLASIDRELGYTRALDGTLMSNDRMKAILRHPRSPSVIIGTIPNITHVENGLGWVDLLLIDSPIGGSSTFRELIEENARKPTNTAINLSKL